MASTTYSTINFDQEQKTVRLDSRENTSNVIYEAYRRKQFDGKNRMKLIWAVSALLATVTVLIIGIMQYDEYMAFINERNDYINQTKWDCEGSYISNVDTTSTIIAGCLIFIYILLYKRRVFLRNKFRFRNVGVPMVVSCWNKNERFYTCCAYGLIAFNVYNVVNNALYEIDFGEVANDLSGLANFGLEIFSILQIALRYYPVLVSYRANTFLISISCALYMCVDFYENIYQYGKCESITVESNITITRSQEIFWYYMLYKILSAVPLCMFSSFIITSLFYHSSINLTDFVLKYKSKYFAQKLVENNRDSCFCALCHVDDENELIFSKHDFEYVFNLVNRKNEIEPAPKTILLKLKKKAIDFYHEYIFEWDSSFRFSSRILNSMTVALVALYYFFIWWSYTCSTMVDKLLKRVIVDSNEDNYEIYIRSFLAETFPDFVEKFSDYLTDPVKISKSNVKFSGNLAPSITWLFIMPSVASCLICLIQFCILTKDFKTHLKEMYKGECEYVKSVKNYENADIAISSFHLGGFLVGYFIWGFMVVYIFIFASGAIVLILRIFAGDAIFGKIALRLLPIVVVYIVQEIVDYIAAAFIFLNRKSKVLALDNFRAYNVFIYFNFYFDCFMGFTSAIIRMIKSIVASILMMPNFSYSFLGRKLEDYDEGYFTYGGFLYMESMHTNPILVTFCALIYYKNLADHMKNHRSLLMPYSSNGRLYKKRVVNKWNLLIRLSMNRELLRYRN